MSVLRWLGLGAAGSSPSGGPEEKGSQAVRELAARLDSMPADRARFVASFAMTLARGARADLEVLDPESGAMVDVLREVAGLPPDQAELIAGMALHRNELLGVSEDYLATRVFRDISSREERLRLLEAVFAICAADESITLVEEEEVRQIAAELGLEHADYVAARASFAEHREVLRGMPRRR